MRLSSPGGAPKRNALLINAHYDSALGTVAASDDAVMVALMLEVAENVVKSAAEEGTLLPHAIVFNFNGAEETNWQVREEGDRETGRRRDSGRRRDREMLFHTAVCRFLVHGGVIVIVMKSFVPLLFFFLVLIPRSPFLIPHLAARRPPPTPPPPPLPPPGCPRLHYAARLG